MENKPSHFSALLFLLISLVLFSTANCGIVTYWGQGIQDEGTLTEACNSGLYETVIIAFLSEFGNSKSPKLNLAGHCNTVPNCPKVGKGIKHCHKKKVKVLLSIGGAKGGYGLSSAADANQLADYLWNNFLGGHSSSRPFGDAILDGIDFDIEGNSEHPENYAVLARKLREYMDKNTWKKFYLSAAPQCPFPDHNQNPALSKVHFDLVFIQFYNNPDCQVGSKASSHFRRSWNKWTKTIKAHKFYVGLLATPDAGTGYVTPKTVLNEVLPFVKKSPKYGGVMLWNRGLDKKSGFSAKIHDSVNK
ncbi:basic endochitinase-like isoform X1 [Arachis stenosperma]|uniref:basic endochitinase-like isoform X1 n=1 Tax=Arachis stenosperma TaxID=217475 RepID=UPI0025AC141A|nr:basic endochitinase-like isoform X1 [Arachis stenosperma]